MSFLSSFANDTRGTQDNLNPQGGVFPILLRTLENIDISNTTDVVFKRNNGNTFKLCHVTLGRFRANVNIEADCSNNNRDGEWMTA